ncbi:ArsR/SmtB family transcription factor [Paeniglutamicibacter sp. NPDC012692]|uniref:ArsR/SmtB family transcription factor n=1 Tax=Paeniglutamicibacter sp. NPDC012692 TaxID=3364388 RepID=UPI003682DA19
MSRDFSQIGRALSAPARSAFINLLMDGSSRPAGELARSAGVSAATASEHLAVLVEAGLVQCQARGRQRFYSLANNSVAGALEQLGHLCPPIPVIGYRQSREARDIARARFCYDHLAGRLGVELLTSMVESLWITEEEYAVTEEGHQRLQSIGIDTNRLTGKRALTRPCPDWTERKTHLAGALGAALGSFFLDRGWVLQRSSGRGLDITPTGTTALGEIWNVRIEPV